MQSFLTAQDNSNMKDKMIEEMEADFISIPFKAGIHQAFFTTSDNGKWGTKFYIPESPKEKLPLVIALHWAGPNGTHAEYFDCLAQPGLAQLDAIIIALDAEGDIWTTDYNAQKIEKLLQLVQKYWDVDMSKIAITGYSNGGNGAWYFAQHHPEIFSAAIPMASAYSILNKIETPMYVVHGEKDELFDLNRTRDWVDISNKAGSDIIWKTAKGKSHFMACGYVSELQEASRWLQEIWK